MSYHLFPKLISPKDTHLTPSSIRETRGTNDKTLKNVSSNVNIYFLFHINMILRKWITGVVPSTVFEDDKNRGWRENNSAPTRTWFMTFGGEI